MIFNSSKKSRDLSNSLRQMTPQGTCGHSFLIFSLLRLGNMETYRTVPEEWRCQRPAQMEEMPEPAHTCGRSLVYCRVFPKLAHQVNGCEVTKVRTECDAATIWVLEALLKFSQPGSDEPPRTTCDRERLEKESLLRQTCCLLFLLLLLLCYSWHDGIIMTISNPPCMQKEVWRLKSPEGFGIFVLFYSLGLTGSC